MDVTEATEVGSRVKAGRSEGHVCGSGVVSSKYRPDTYLRNDPWFGFVPNNDRLATLA